MVVSVKKEMVPHIDWEFQTCFPAENICKSYKPGSYPIKRIKMGRIVVPPKDKPDDPPILYQTVNVLDGLSLDGVTSTI